MKSSLVFLIISTFFGNRAIATPVSDAKPAAPVRHCELQLSTWCISEGAYEINRKLASDSIHDRIWTVRGRFNPDSQLIIMEPNGCKQGFSDNAELVDVRKDVPIEGKLWNQMTFKLKKSGACNLEVLSPVKNEDPMEWANSTGLALIQTCEDKYCSGKTLLDLRSNRK
ncbi:hypothetical protein [Duganella sp. LjRoot269]|jgi:hypothetical protein|uniref:hypothetical protein n=1 Tax=Duganella sp. LjRoot269 TaxID=3342305 RepID=UPI00159D80C7